MTAHVRITTSGRGGSIHYLEDEHSITFHWEFAASPALALIIGPTSTQWDADVPWASGRQLEIFEHVAREAIRQKTSGGEFSLDLDTGTIVVYARG